MPVNIGNPNEMTLLELAERVIALTGQTRRSCSRGSRWTTPRCANPTSPRRARCWTGSRGSDSTTACAARSRASPQPRPQRRLVRNLVELDDGHRRRRAVRTTSAPPSQTSASCGASSKARPSRWATGVPASATSARWAPSRPPMRSLAGTLRTATRAVTRPRRVITLRSLVGPPGSVAEVAASPANAQGTNAGSSVLDPVDRERHRRGANPDQHPVDPREGRERAARGDLGDADAPVELSIVRPLGCTRDLAGHPAAVSPRHSPMVAGAQDDGLSRAATASARRHAASCSTSALDALEPLLVTQPVDELQAGSASRTPRCRNRAGRPPPESRRGRR